MAETVDFGSCECCSPDTDDGTSCCDADPIVGDVCATLTGTTSHPPFSFIDPIVMVLADGGTPPIGAGDSWGDTIFGGVTFSGANWSPFGFGYACGFFVINVVFFCDTTEGTQKWRMWANIYDAIGGTSFGPVYYPPTAVSCDPVSITFVLDMYLQDNGDGTFFPYFAHAPLTVGDTHLPITVVITQGSCTGTTSPQNDPDC
jgi:hypothetical protein